MKEIILLLLAIIVLVLYLFLWGSMIWRVSKNKPPTETLGLVWTANLVAGISTGLAVSVLGASEPDTSLSFANIIPISEESEFVGIMTFAFLFSWVAIGLATLLSGVFKSNPNPENTNITTMYNTIRNYGMIWIGMAVSAVALMLGVS